MFTRATVTAGFGFRFSRTAGPAPERLAERELLRPVEDAAAEAGQRRREERELVVEHQERVPGHRIFAKSLSRDG